MKKRTSIALSLITASAFSDVFLSYPCRTFEMFGSALLLQPTGSHLHYASQAARLLNIGF